MTQREQIAKRLAQMQPTMRGAYRSAMRGRSAKSGIKSFCYECMGYVRAEVAACTDLGCPLYPYRPGRTKAKQGRLSATDARRIKKLKMNLVRE